MSHVEEVEIECRDLDALKAAVEACGGEFIVGQKTHAWWGTWLNDWRDPNRSAAVRGIDPKTFGKCEHAIRMAGQPGKNGANGPWEIGVTHKGTDGWSLVYDNYGSAGRALERVFGKDLLRLKDELAAEVSTRELVRDGWRLTRTLVDGEIVLQADR